MSQFKAQDFVDQINSNGEAADVWQAVPVGTSHTATGGDKSHSVWMKTATTVLVVTTSADIPLDNAIGYLPKGHLAIRLNPNLLIPGQRAAVVLKTAGRVRRAAATITRATGSSSDTLNHPFITKLETVRNGDTAYTNWSLVTNSNALLPFAPDALLWTTGSKPADGDKYGVAYQYHPQFDLVTGPATLAQMGSDGLLMPVTLPLLEKPTGGDQ